jgi:6-phosphogluconolactonase
MPELLVYVGTYTVRGSEGIYAYRFDTETGALRLSNLAARVTNPTFLAVDHQRSCLYSVEETGGGKIGAIHSYSVDLTTGRLTLLNVVPSLGAGPCYIAFDKTGRYLFTANYHSGSIAIFPRLEDGRLGEASAFVQHQGSSRDLIRQHGPHAHAVATSPDNQAVLVADLGLDKLLLYQFEATKGSIPKAEPAFAKMNDGAGPRHFAFHPNGRFLYVVNELDSTVTQLSFDAVTRSLRIVKTIPSLPEGFVGPSHAAHMQIDARGRFLYVSNRGHDSISVFSIDPTEGALDIVEHVSPQGKTPRGFALDPTGEWLLVANEDSDNIAIFRVSQQTGTLTPAGQVFEIPSPVFLLFP